jgi:hypothetical protein
MVFGDINGIFGLYLKLKRSHKRSAFLRIDTLEEIEYDEGYYSNGIVEINEGNLFVENYQKVDVEIKYFPIKE